MTLRSAAAAVAIFVCGSLYGNWDGDQTTLRNCANSGAAEMAGGGEIQCSVKTK